jgi:hypothetical protein
MTRSTKRRSTRKTRTPSKSRRRTNRRTGGTGESALKRGIKNCLGYHRSSLNQIAKRHHVKGTQKLNKENLCYVLQDDRRFQKNNMRLKNSRHAKKSRKK